MGYFKAGDGTRASDFKARLANHSDIFWATPIGRGMEMGKFTVKAMRFINFRANVIQTGPFTAYWAFLVQTNLFLLNPYACCFPFVLP